MSDPAASASPALLVAAGWLRKDADEACDVVTAGLRAANVACETQFVESVDAASDAARHATETRRPLVVAVGDDALVHGVVNGLADLEPDGEPSARVELGLVGVGADSGFVRTFGLDRPPSRLVAHLVGSSRMPIDLARAHWRDASGQAHARLFANIAIVGGGVDVVNRARRLPRALGPLRTAAARLGVPGAARRPTTVTVEGSSTDEPVSAVVIANGQFTGGGLHLSPRSIPTDGRLEVQTWRRRATYMARRAHRLSNGRHLQGADTRLWSTASVEVTSVGPLALRLDGVEVDAATDIRIGVLRGALHLRV